jgi:hemerythrin-like domain-containing protein
MGRLHTPLAPGQAAPAPDFDTPFEMLAACHDRVRRSLDLLQRLVAHWQRHGADAQARGAAADVWRYFELAAPQHHLDEERHVIPRLLASGDAALAAAARRMLDDHDRFRALWATLGPALAALRDGAAPDSGWVSAAGEFIARHTDADGHLALEDGLGFPAALAATPQAEWPAMGAEMAARRRPPPR